MMCVAGTRLPTLSKQPLVSSLYSYANSLSYVRAKKLNDAHSGVLPDALVEVLSQQSGCERRDLARWVIEDEIL